MTRSEDFADGAERVRQPQFQSVQTQHNANFRAMSVLDTPYAIPNQNGIGTQDLQRRMIGFKDAATGRSEGTYDQQIWLSHPETTPRSSRKKTEDGE
jgi:hypothetical protein